MGEVEIEMCTVGRKLDNSGVKWLVGRPCVARTGRTVRAGGGGWGELEDVFSEFLRGCDLCAERCTEWGCRGLVFQRALHRGERGR